MKPRVIGQRAYETQLLIDRLKKLFDDGAEDTVTYDELSKIAGKEVRAGGDGYGYLCSARRIVERDMLKLLGVVAGVGIKRLSLEEQAAVGPDGVLRLKRFARRRYRRLGCVEYDRLTADQKAKHNVAASIYGVVELFTRAKSVERLSGAVQQAAARLPIGNTLALFQESTNGSG